MNQDISQSIARNIVRNWLSQKGWNQNRFAKSAGMNRSLVSRFLAGQPVDPDTCIKMFNAVQGSLDIYQKRQLLDGFGILALAEAINPTFANPNDFGLEQPPVGHHAGTRYLLQGHDIAKHSWEQARMAFELAEKAFGPLSSQASYAAVNALDRKSVV